MLLFAILLASADPSPPFPERVPGMVEACIRGAVDEAAVSDEDDDYKYICTGEPAETIWRWLEQAKIESWEQDPDGEGHWLGRAFPLGACFKRLRTADGTPAADGLSCTIWVPHPKARSGPGPSPR